MLTVAQAAARLGVTAHEVRRLIHEGVLAAQRIGNAYLLSDDAVDSRLRLPIRAGRSLAPLTAWAALWELSGERATWLDASRRSRLRSRLRPWSAEQLVAAVRDRADKAEVRLLPVYRDRLLSAEGVFASGMTAAAAVGADIVAVGAADEIYCSAGTLAALRSEYGLSDRGQANLVVRVPRFEQLPMAGRPYMPSAVVGVDLAESVDVRTRRAGLDLLSDALTVVPR